MRIYFVTTVLATLLYPIACALSWSSKLAADILGGFWSGGLVSLGVGIGSALMLLFLQRMTRNAPQLLRGALIRLGASELVGCYSVVLLELLYLIDGGAFFGLTLYIFFLLHVPGFLASIISYHLAGLLVGTIAPAEPTKKK